jgi:hypothetical protein
MSDTFDPGRAAKTAVELEQDAEPARGVPYGKGSVGALIRLTDSARSAASMLRAAAATIARQDMHAATYINVIEGHSKARDNLRDQLCAMEADRDRLAARVAELAKLAGEACDALESHKSTREAFDAAERLRSRLGGK